MKKYHLRVLILVCFTVSAVISVSASELRVGQLGSPWLVHDEYADVLVNPAMINFIGKNILTVEINDMVAHQFMSPDNYVLWQASPRLACLGKFGMLNAGLIYGLDSRVSTVTGIDASRYLDHAMTGIAGVKLNDNFSLGLEAYTGIRFDAFTGQSAYEGGLGMGFNYAGDGIGAGLALNADTDFSGRENYSWSAAVNGSINTGGESQVRFINETNNARVDIGPELNGYPNPFGDVFFGYYQVFNLTGISYVNSYYLIKYYVELHNDWNVYSYSKTGKVIAGIAESEEIAIRGDTVYLQFGVETNLFWDWFTFRVKYTPVYYSYLDEFRHQKFGIPDNEFRTSTDTLAIMGSQRLSVGFGFDIADGMKLDVGFDYNGLINRYETFYYNPGTPADTMNVQNISQVTAEFTMKW